MLTIFPWSTARSQERSIVQVQQEPFVSVAFSQDGRYLAGADRSVLFVWDLKNKRRVNRVHVQTFKETINYLAFSPNRNLLAIAASDGASPCLIVIDSAKWQVQRRINDLSGVQGPQMPIAFLRDGKSVLAATPTIELAVWDITTGKRIAESKGHRAKVTALAVCADGKTFATGRDDTDIVIWDAKSLQPKFTISNASKGIKALVFSPDGKTLAANSETFCEGDWSLLGEKPTVTLWDVAKRKEKVKLFAWSSSVSALAYSSDGKVLAIGNSRFLNLAEAQTGNRWAVIKPSNWAGPGKGRYEILRLAFSPDGKTIATISMANLMGGESSIQVWDIPQSKQQPPGGKPLPHDEAMIWKTIVLPAKK